MYSNSKPDKMEKRNETKMITVISVYKSKEQRTMKFVQLTSEQFGKYFPKNSVCEFSHISTLSEYSDKYRKFGIISVENLTIGSTKQIVVELKPCSFTKRFSDGPFKVFTRCDIRFPEPIEDVDETEQPTDTVVIEQPSINVLETEPLSETTTTDDSTREESNETMTSKAPKTGPTPIRSLRNNYSPIFRSNVHSMWFQLNRIA